MNQHGPLFKTYVDAQRINKNQLAEDLGMSPQNLFQLFKSKAFKADTVKKIEGKFGITFKGLLEAAQRYQSEMQTREATEAITNMEKFANLPNSGFLNTAHHGRVDYQEKYIRLLEQQVEERNNLVKILEDYLKEMVVNLKELKANQLLSAAAQQGYHEFWIESAPPQGMKKEAAKKALNHKVDEALRRLEEQSTS